MSEFYTGKDVVIGFKKEATPLTPETSGFLSVGDVQSFSPKQSNELDALTRIERINPRAIAEGKYTVGGSIEYYVQNGAFGIINLGQWDTTSDPNGATNGSNYIHYGCTEDSTSTATTPVEKSYDTYTLQVGINGTVDKVLTYEGCMASSLTLTCGFNEPLKANVQFVAQKLNTSTATAPTVTHYSEGPYMFFNKGELKINGVAKVDVQSLNATVDANPEGVHGILPADEKRCIQAWVYGPRKVSGDVMLAFDSFDEMEYFFSSTASQDEPGDSSVQEFDISLLVDNGVSPDTSASYRANYISVNNVKFGREGMNIGKTGLLTETFSFEGLGFDWKYYDATQANPF
jgi:hypothetical protein